MKNFIITRRLTESCIVEAATLDAAIAEARDNYSVLWSTNDDYVKLDDYQGEETSY